jgi:hypothetical protein
MGVDAFPLEPEMTSARLANGAQIGLIHVHPPGLSEDPEVHS